FRHDRDWRTCRGGNSIFRDLAIRSHARDCISVCLRNPHVSIGSGLDIDGHGTGGEQSKSADLSVRTDFPHGPGALSREPDGLAVGADAQPVGKWVDRVWASGAVESYVVLRDDVGIVIQAGDFP